MTSKHFLICGSFLAGLAVALGAVGSHALKETLLANGRTETFETAVRYQFYHGLALTLIGILGNIYSEVKFSATGTLMLAGVILFSGSLYALSLTPVHWVVYATPVGGILMIGGWVILIFKLTGIRK